MDDFIAQAKSQLGLGESQAREATGGIMGMIKDQLGGGDFSELASKIPGADAIAGSGGGGGGGLLGKVGGLLGGKGDSALGALGALGKAGLEPDQMPGFLSLLTNFIKEKAGGDMLSKIFDKVPDLRSMLG